MRIMFFLLNKKVGKGIMRHKMGSNKAKKKKQTV